MRLKFKFEYIRTMIPKIYLGNTPIPPLLVSNRNFCSKQHNSWISAPCILTLSQVLAWIQTQLICQHCIHWGPKYWGILKPWFWEESYDCELMSSILGQALSRSKKLKNCTVAWKYRKRMKKRPVKLYFNKN